MIRAYRIAKCSECLTLSSALTILSFSSRRCCTHSSSSGPSFADGVKTQRRKARRKSGEEDGNITGPAGRARRGGRGGGVDSYSRRSRAPSRGRGLPRSEDTDDIVVPSSQQHQQKETVVPPEGGVKSWVVNSTSPSIDAYNRLIISRYEDWTAQIAAAEREWDAAIHSLKRYIIAPPFSSEKGGAPTSTRTNSNTSSSTSSSTTNSDDGSSSSSYGIHNEQQKQEGLPVSLLSLSQPIGPFEARQLEERLASWRREQNRIESQRSYALHNLQQLQNKKARHRQLGDEEDNSSSLLASSSPSTVFDVFSDAANLLALSSQRLAEHRHKEQNSSVSPPTSQNYHGGEVASEEPLSGAVSTSARTPTLHHQQSSTTSFLESEADEGAEGGGAFFMMKNEGDEVAAMLDPCGFTLSAVVVGVDNQQQEKLSSHQLKVGSSSSSSSSGATSTVDSNVNSHHDRGTSINLSGRVGESRFPASPFATSSSSEQRNNNTRDHYDQPLSMPKRTNRKEEERVSIENNSRKSEKTTPFMAFAAERLKVLSHNAAAAGGVAAGAVANGVAGAEGTSSNSNNASIILLRLSQLSLEYQQLPRYLRSVFEAMCAPRTNNGNDGDCGTYPHDGDNGGRSGRTKNGDTVSHQHETQEAGVGGHQIPSAEDRDREHALMFLRELEAFVSYSIFTVQSLVKSGVIPTPTTSTATARGSSGTLRREVGSNSALLASALSVVPHTWQLMNTEEKMRWCPSMNATYHHNHSTRHDDQNDNEETRLVAQRRKGGKGAGDGKVSERQQGVRAGRLMLARAPSLPKTALRSKSDRQHKSNENSEQKSYSDLTPSFENRGTRLLEEKRGIVSEGSAQHGVEETKRGENNFVASSASVSSVPAKDVLEEKEDKKDSDGLVEDDDDPLKWLSHHMTML